MIAHYEIIRFLLCYCGYYVLGDVLVKAGDKEVVLNVEHFLAAYRGFHDFARKQHAKVKHYLEQQVFRSSVGLDVVYCFIKQGLLEIVGGVINFLHVGAVEFQHAETAVKINARVSAIFFAARRIRSLPISQIFL